MLELQASAPCGSGSALTRYGKAGCLDTSVEVLLQARLAPPARHRTAHGRVLWSKQNHVYQQRVSAPLRRTVFRVRPAQQLAVVSVWDGSCIDSNDPALRPGQPCWRTEQ